MRISDCSSDVCSSDLARLASVDDHDGDASPPGALDETDAGIDHEGRAGDHESFARVEELLGLAELIGGDDLYEEQDDGLEHAAADRNSAGTRKSVSGGVDSGGSRIIQQKKQNKK